MIAFWLFLAGLYSLIPTSPSSPHPATGKPAPRAEMVDRVDQLLPQTQCTQCDYPRCREYARVIVEGSADINQCPPGGRQTILALADLTGQPVKPLNPDNGVEEPRLVAVIDEAACIGCKLCIKACPVDCIVGGPKLMHTVITEQCTGCKLCVPVCPTDCIDLPLAPEPDPACLPSRWPAFTQPEVDLARQRTEQKLARIARREAGRRARKIRKKRDQLKKEIAAAVERKRSARTS